MDRKAELVLQDYERRAADEAKREKEISRESFIEHLDEFLLAVGPAAGELIHLLVKESKSQTILEIGTSFGYSTLWLADAAREIGGKVITIDLHEGKQKYAKEQLRKAELDRFVEFRLGNAKDVLANLDVSVDFVLLDLWKDLYIPCFDLFYPRLNPGALVVADNMIYPESSNHHAMAYRKHVRAKGDIQSVLLTVGHGLELSRCVRGVNPVWV